MSNTLNIESGSDSSGTSLFFGSYLMIPLIGMLGSIVLWYTKIIIDDLIYGRLFYQLNLQDDCKQYSWFCSWFSRHPYTKHGSSCIKIHKNLRSNSSQETRLVDASELVSKLDTIFVPNYGTHVLYRNGNAIIVNTLVRNDTQNQDTNKSREQITIYIPKYAWFNWLIKLFFPCLDGVNNVNSISEMLEKKDLGNNFSTYESVELSKCGDAYSVFKELLMDFLYVHTIMNVGKISIFTPYYNDHWRNCLTKDNRILDTLVLDKGIWDDLYNDVSKFLRTKQWYKTRGIPYRRGYLLYGEPGCGKTSTISLIASQFNMDIYMMSLNNLGDSGLGNMFALVPVNSIIVLEDIDSLFPSDNKDNTESDVSQCNSVVKTNSKLSFSAVLNCLDGICCGEDRIIFMTTNFKDKLPPSLIRDGRIDRKIYIGLVTEYQFDRMLNNFYPDRYTPEESLKIWNNLKDYKFSMALLQGFFLRNETIDEVIKSSYNFENYIKETQNNVE